MKTTSQRVKPNSCKTHQHEADRPTLDSRLQPNMGLQDPTIGASFAFLTPEWPPSEIICNFFPSCHDLYSDGWRTLATSLGCARLDCWVAMHSGKNDRDSSLNAKWGPRSLLPNTYRQYSDCSMKLTTHPHTVSGLRICATSRSLLNMCLCSVPKWG